jgi:hypothetical protein
MREVIACVSPTGLSGKQQLILAVLPASVTLFSRELVCVRFFESLIGDCYGFGIHVSLDAGRIGRSSCATNSFGFHSAVHFDRFALIGASSTAERHH